MVQSFMALPVVPLMCPLQCFHLLPFLTSSEVLMLQSGIFIYLHASQTLVIEMDDLLA